MAGDHPAVVIAAVVPAARPERGERVREARTTASVPGDIAIGKRLLSTISGGSCAYTQAGMA